MNNIFTNNKDVKEMLLLIMHKEGITQQDIINKYNAKYNKELTKQSFSRILNNNTFKYTVLIDILDSIGYCVQVKKKL